MKRAFVRRTNDRHDGIKLRYCVNKESRRLVWWQLGWPSAFHVFSVSMELAIPCLFLYHKLDNLLYLNTTVLYFLSNVPLSWGIAKLIRVFVEIIFICSYTWLRLVREIINLHIQIGSWWYSELTNLKINNISNSKINKFSFINLYLNFQFLQICRFIDFCSYV